MSRDLKADTLRNFAQTGTRAIPTGKGYGAAVAGILLRHAQEQGMEVSVSFHTHTTKFGTTQGSQVRGTVDALYGRTGVKVAGQYILLSAIDQISDVAYLTAQMQAEEDRLELADRKLEIIDRYDALMDEAQTREELLALRDARREELNNLEG